MSFLRQLAATLKSGFSTRRCDMTVDESLIISTLHPHGHGDNWEPVIHV